MYEWRPQALLTENSNQEQRNSRNMKSSQGFADGTYQEQDMEQLDTATGTASHTKEPLVTDIDCVRLPAPLYGFV